MNYFQQKKNVGLPLEDTPHKIEEMFKYSDPFEQNTMTKSTQNTFLQVNN